MLIDTVFLAAQTSRSSAYAQALANANLRPEKTFIFGAGTAMLPGQIEETSSDLGPGEKEVAALNLFFPSPTVMVDEVCLTQGWDTDYAACDNVNDPMIRELLENLSPELVIYSGFGGQIVKNELLELGIPFLHIHSGWLPAYRGSTTLYYSLLQERECAASAFVLDAEIDTGTVVRRKKYPIPPLNMDLDHVYDGAIRADLLVEVLKIYESERSLPQVDFDNDKPGKIIPYYVIHPVLKHIAYSRRR